jgi:hypothetical protein
VSTSAEKLGIKLLRALKREKESGKTLLNCRPLSVIAAEIGFTESERDQAVKFLLEKQAINGLSRPDGQAALPSLQGETLLASKKQESAWTMDRRLALYPIAIAILTLLSFLIARCR